MEDTFDFDAEFRVRLPSELAERIAQTAKKERRSRNLQYVYMLENWFELKGKLDERVTRLETLAAEKTDVPDGGEKAGERRKKAAM
jgi:hypothetical protein